MIYYNRGQKTDFFMPTGAFSRRSKDLTVFCPHAERSPFLLEEKMLKDKEQRRLYHKKYLKKSPWAKYKYYITTRCFFHPYYNGEKRKIKNLITIQELKELWFRDKPWLLKRPSLDRINGNGHYVKENCRFIERPLNSATKRTNKITFEIAQKIRKMLVKGIPQDCIAKKYKVTQSFISEIKHNIWYKPETYGKDII
jgi:hypothetical protein